MKTRETQLRSVTKTLIWRFIAVMNSFLVLVSGLTQDSLLNALYMNLSGFVLYYVYERTCNRISYGIIEIEE